MIFYVDASIPVAVRTALAMVRDDVLYAGGPGAPKENTQDKDWLRIAGANDWVVLKRDKKIRTRPWERQALIDAQLRTFCLTAGGKLHTMGNSPTLGGQMGSDRRSCREPSRPVHLFRHLAGGP